MSADTSCIGTNVVESEPWGRIEYLTTQETNASQLSHYCIAFVWIIHSLPLCLNSDSHDCHLSSSLPSLIASLAVLTNHLQPAPGYRRNRSTTVQPTHQTAEHCSDSVATTQRSPGTTQLRNLHITEFFEHRLGIRLLPRPRLAFPALRALCERLAPTKRGFRTYHYLSHEAAGLDHCITALSPRCEAL